MNKAQLRRTGVCIYCGTTAELTDDHVPPKVIFPDPLPSTLITVPACLKCNKTWEKDDEYFGMRLPLNDAVRGHPAVNAKFPKIFRALDRPQAGGFKRALLADWRDVQVTTPGGIQLGRKPAFNVDLGRIFRVIDRTVRGLFYYETGDRLPDTFDVMTVSDETIGQHGATVCQEIRQEIIQPLTTVAPKVIGDGVFAYRFLLSENPPASAWATTFFNRLSFLSVIGPRRSA